LVLKVAGPYGELVKYVQALESALPGLRWGTMELKTDKRGNELTLRVYAVGVQL
jgi:MSHA biogenesis protein MshJ